MRAALIFLLAACGSPPPALPPVPPGPVMPIYVVVARTMSADDELLRIEIASDGSWTAEEGGATTSGALDETQLASLSDQIVTTTVVAVEPEGGLCDALPHVRIVITTGGSSAEFFDLCDVAAHPSLEQLHDRVRELVGLRPN